MISPDFQVCTNPECDSFIREGPNCTGLHSDHTYWGGLRILLRKDWENAFPEERNDERELFFRRKK